MNAPRILVFIPTLNERDNVTRMAKELAALDVVADILFLDDNSPDGTGDVLDELARANARMSVIHRSGRQGIGSAHQVGIAHAYDQGYDTLVTLDCDFTHEPKDIPRMLAALSGHDMVVGSRYMEQGSLPGWNLLRRFLTMFGHFLTSNLLGLPQDASGAFRAYDLRRVNREFFGLVVSKSYSFFFESLFVLVQNGCQIKEIPIVLPARTYGHSKLTASEAMRGGRFLLSLWLESVSHPERFRLGRPLDAVLGDPPATYWDSYWAKKQNMGAFAYEMTAAIYRKLFIRPNLQRVLQDVFPSEAALLHAGCGSGQSDVDLHSRFKVTAVDISLEALTLYSSNNFKAWRVEQADIFQLPFADESFDGAFNLGVMEHFTFMQIILLLAELRRVLKPGGRVVFFWPHAKATSVWALKAERFIMSSVLQKDILLHPDEITLMSGKAMARALLQQAGFILDRYSFGPRDMLIQAVLVGKKV